MSFEDAIAALGAEFGVALSDESGTVSFEVAPEGGDFEPVNFTLTYEPDDEVMLVSADVGEVDLQGGDEALLKMLEAIEERNKIRPDVEDDINDEVLETDTFTYVGEDHPPKEVKTIIVGSDVKEIEDGAFKDLPNLKCVVFSDEAIDMKIGKNALENCPNLTTIRLNGVTYIGDEAFLNCSGLVAVELGADVQHIGMGAFKNCTALSGESIEQILKTTTEVKAGVSEGCLQTDESYEISIPANISSINDDAFKDCNINKVNVPAKYVAPTAKSFSVDRVGTPHNGPHNLSLTDGQICNAGYGR